MKHGWNNSIKPEFESDPVPDIDSEVEPFDREQTWKEGWHKSWDGEMTEIKEMSDQYLRYTIHYYGRELDTTPLRDELEKRNKTKC